MAVEGDGGRGGFIVAVEGDGGRGGTRSSELPLPVLLFLLPPPWWRQPLNAFCRQIIVMKIL